jgi:hypothetical protein
VSYTVYPTPISTAVLPQSLLLFFLSIPILLLPLTHAAPSSTFWPERPSTWYKCERRIRRHPAEPFWDQFISGKERLSGFTMARARRWNLSRLTERREEGGQGTARRPGTGGGQRPSKTICLQVLNNWRRVCRAAGRYAVMHVLHWVHASKSCWWIDQS